MSKGETLASDIANSNFVRNSNSLSLYSSSCQQNNKKFIFLCQTKQFFIIFLFFMFKFVYAMAIEPMDLFFIM